MVQRYGTDQPAARRARRLGRWRVGAPARDADSSRRARLKTAAWFDDWLTGAEKSDLAATAAAAAPEGWTVLRDLQRPGSPLAAIGPGGVVVVTTLRWDGAVEVVDGTLRHRGYGRTPDVAAVADTAGAVTSLLAPSHRRAVQAVLCLAGSDLEPVAVRGGAVAVGERRLRDHLRALPTLLDPADVPLVVDYLTAELADATSPGLLTVDDVFRPASIWSTDVPRPYADPDARDAAARHRPGAALPGGATGPVDGTAEPAATRPSAGRRRGAVGDGLLRVGLLVLGLLTIGNVLLAWLAAAG